MSSGRQGCKATRGLYSVLLNTGKEMINKPVYFSGPLQCFVAEELLKLQNKEVVPRILCGGLIHWQLSDLKDKGKQNMQVARLFKRFD